MSAAIVSLCLIVFPGIATAQSASVFEVASVRANRTARGRASAEFLRGGERFAATNISLGTLIVIAYGVTVRQVSPLDSVVHDKYDIQARAEHAVTRDRMLLMLQSLLMDRFSLRMRREMKEVSAYALVVGEHGSRMRQSEQQLPWSLTRARGKEQNRGNIGLLIYENESMSDFAFTLSSLLAVGRPVVDETGLSGAYDFEVSYTPADLPEDHHSEPSAPSIFTALQEQLGLKLEPRRAKLQFLTIEHFENPREN
jgi:uncharacterized protein (TIGR03435 family)